MEPKAKIRVTIDGSEIVVDEGLTILEAARQNGVHIPTLCHHRDLSNWGGCRLCVVEVDEAPRLVASCVMPVRDGMRIVTSNARIIESRRTVLEFLFAERNHNCMFCPRSGDCELQSLAYEMQMDHLTVSQSFEQYPVDITSSNMGIDHNRCILCGRCVRACAELAGNRVLGFQNRGKRSLVGLDLNETRAGSSCYECGICLQVCPTGAIFNRHRTHYAVKGHPRDWQTMESVCPLCGLTCPTVATVQDNYLLKIEGRQLDADQRPDRGQLCSRGRFEVLKKTGQRLLQPMVRSANGQWTVESREKALDYVAAKMKSALATDGEDALFGIASSNLSNEVLALFRDLMTQGWAAGLLDTLDGACFRTLKTALEKMGASVRETAWKRIPQSDFVLVCGTDPCQSQPMIRSLLRRSILEKGTRVAILGPQDFMEPLTTYYLSVQNGEMSGLVQSLLNEAGRKAQAASAPKVRSKKAARPAAAGMPGRSSPDALNLGPEAQQVFDQVAAEFGSAKNPILVAGHSMLSADDAAGLKGLAELALLKGMDPSGFLGLIILKPWGNSAGAWKLGVASANGNIAGDHLKAGLLVLGGETAPEAMVWQGQHPPDFLGVFSPYIPPNLLDKAHVLIPTPTWLEEDGTYTALDGGEVAFVQKVLDPPAGVAETRRTLLSLAQRAGFHFNFKALNDRTRHADQDATVRR
jgi:NADH dehydrogenase/NADH:ubiquinone oxidoreductase subunit G